MKTGEEILKRFGDLKQGRSRFESLWQQIAERMLPGSADFVSKRQAGEERTERMYDATAALALRSYSQFVESNVTPATQRWHRMTISDEDLDDNPEVKLYLDEWNGLLFRERYSPATNFSGQISEVYPELGAFGNGSLYTDEVPGYGLRYSARKLSETYFSENHVGLIDTVFRRYPLTARQAVEEFGKERVPPHIYRCVERAPDSLHWFVQAVIPNDGTETGEGVREDHLFASITISEDGAHVMRRSGFYSFPYAIARDLTSPGEIYGRSPGVWVLPDVKMLNEMNRSVIRAAHKAVEPPMMLTEDGALQSFDFRPGALNYGALGPNGERLALPMESGSRLDIGVELMAAKQEAIRSAFYINLFQIFADDGRQRTAYEVARREQEKAMLLGPLVGRLRSEFRERLVQREIDLHIRAGRAPEMPRVLIDRGGANFTLHHESPIARAQRAEEGVAVIQTMESIASLVQVQPDILDNFDTDEIARVMAEVNGMGAKLVRPADQVAAIREQRAQQQQQQAMADAAPGVARAAKDLSQVAA